jgi:pimeloyl-ACP methyl ester carboxylesterase
MTPSPPPVLPAGVQEFSVAVPATGIADLRARLAATRWPDQLEGAGWAYGVERGWLQELCAYWRDGFSWEGFHDRLNAFPQYTADIDGEHLHFYDVPAERPGAPVVLVLHGWPSSVAEFLDVMGPLTSPSLHGGDAADAVTLVVPSLPGYGFSGPTRHQGVDAARVADLLDGLMTLLGHTTYSVYGGDWGSTVGVELGARYAHHVRGVHLTMLLPEPPDADHERDGFTDEDHAMADRRVAWRADEIAYQAEQSTKPQTLAYGLNDSPAGLAAWIGEKWRTWTDRRGLADDAFAVPLDRLLDTISVYWVTQTINSSMRLYYENNGPGRARPRPTVVVPLGYTSFPEDVPPTPRPWIRDAFDIVRWSDQPRGGHFPAVEVPDLLVPEILAFLRVLDGGE